ncbi:MAG TPA: hypothetical protein VJZ27_13300, partial [Aggregatilineales bacterium]|nr:hypothetical protein [Aggregatilineales bacterium]
MREIGQVKFVQIQQHSLKKENGSIKVYEPSPLIMVHRLRLSNDGIIGITANGVEIIDVHHKNHPKSRYRVDNGISIGFTTHYDAIRGRFGDHLRDGIGGENIMLQVSQTFALEDLQAGKLIFKNPERDGEIHLEAIEVIEPCEPFSQFCAGRHIGGKELKETLQFLHE